MESRSSVTVITQNLYNNFLELHSEAHVKIIPVLTNQCCFLKRFCLKGMGPTFSTTVLNLIVGPLLFCAETWGSFIGNGWDSAERRMDSLHISRKYTLCSWHTWTQGLTYVSAHAMLTEGARQSGAHRSPWITAANSRCSAGNDDGWMDGWMVEKMRALFFVWWWWWERQGAVHVGCSLCLLRGPSSTVRLLDSKITDADMDGCDWDRWPVTATSVWF